MLTTLQRPTGVERFFDDSEVIVSKTDLKGIITYANRVFLRVADYTEDELLGRPHNVIRHPDMPHCVFKLLWDTLGQRQEVFAYVVNLAKNGDHYWVFAHVTPSFDNRGNVVGFHSHRRVPSRAAIEKVVPLYAALVNEEQRHHDWRTGMLAAERLLVNLLNEKNTTYDEFVFSL